MLPILVLLVASSAVAFPGIQQVNLVSSNDIRYNENTPVGSLLSLYNDDDANINELTMGAVLRDLSKSSGNQARSSGQALAVLGEVATGRPGDACAAANYINAYTRYVESGNTNGVRDALANYVQVLNGNIDNIVRLATNRDSVRYASGSRGGCPGEGRTYQFDSAWDIIIGSAAPNQQSIVNEEYSVAKRLYCAFNAVSNNVGAQVTAASLPASAQLFEIVGGPLADFVSRVSSKQNLEQSAANLKRALSGGVRQVSL